MPDPAFVEEQRALVARKFPGVDAAREAIIECVAASATEPFDAGVALGRERFNACRQSDASRALRHLFFAERGMRPRAAPRPVATLGVLGAGTMGSGIAISLATAGFDVVLVDTQPAALAAGIERVRTTVEASVAKGRMTPAAATATLSRVRSGDRIDALQSADLVIEAVFESLAVKREVFAALGRLCRPGAVLASNTSTLDIDAIAQASGRAQDVIGMHFFSPANIMRLVEIVRGREALALFGWKPYMHNPRLKRWLHRIDLPTLLLWGAQDRIVTPAYGEGWRTAIPGARIEQIPDAGHFPHWEQPQQFAERVAAFAGEVELAPGAKAKIALVFGQARDRATALAAAAAAEVETVERELAATRAALSA